jgi:hypothetical protein
MRILLAALLVIASATAIRGAELQKVRFFVSGSYCAGCSGVLTDALAAAGVKNASRLPPNRNGSVLVLGEISQGADLSSLAAAINKAETPHRKQAPPGLALEVFCKLDEKSSAAAREALAKVPGIDAKASMPKPSAGVLEVKLTGESKVTVEQIVAALNAAGLQASVLKP